VLDRPSLNLPDLPTHGDDGWTMDRETSRTTSLGLSTMESRFDNGATERWAFECCCVSDLPASKPVWGLFGELQLWL
jgi:hypothetical protein